MSGATVPDPSEAGSPTEVTDATGASTSATVHTQTDGVGLDAVIAALAAALPTVTVVSAERPGEPADALAERGALHGAAGRTRVSLRVIGDVLQVGPLLRPGDRGCDWCADRRHRAVLRDDAKDAISTHTSPLVADDLDRAVVAPTWIPTVVVLTADMLTQAPTGAPDDARTVYTVSLAGGALERHRLDPVPACPHCGPGAPSAPPTGFVSRPILDLDGLRCRPAPDAAMLDAALIDHRFGPVRRVYRDAFAPGALAGVEVAVPGINQRLWGYGRASTHPVARVVGLLEAVERESGFSPQRSHELRYGSYRELVAELGADAVLDPATLGLPEACYEAHPSAATVGYTSDTRTSWLRGWMPRQERLRWVPEHLAYYGAPARDDSARFLYECSSGVALGGTREEAALYGAFELIERDAFLLHWYSRAALDPIDLATVRDSEARVYLDRATADGYTIHLFDATSDVGLPVIQALAINPENGDGATFSAAGAHPDPQRAARAAVQEVVVMILLQGRAARTSREDRLAMLADPTLVREMDDHVAVHTLPEAIERFDHLLMSGLAPVGLDSLATSQFDPDPADPDMAAVADALFSAMVDASMDPMVVDLSSARDARLGLAVVKVIAAGAIPLTFGHVHHRTLGIPRLDVARARTGESGDVLVHPFP